MPLRARTKPAGPVDKWSRASLQALSVGALQLRQRSGDDGRSTGFGSVRRLSSGRWQARFPDARGTLWAAPDTFRIRAEASSYLALVHTEQYRGSWVDPAAGKGAFGYYAADWMKLRDLRPRTREPYAGLLANHLLPPLTVRTGEPSGWAAGTGASTVAKAYRLSNTIMSTAVVDELIVRNLCVLPRAGIERPTERVPPT